MHVQQCSVDRTPIASSEVWHDMYKYHITREEPRSCLFAYALEWNADLFDVFMLIDERGQMQTSLAAYAARATSTNWAYSGNECSWCTYKRHNIIIRSTETMWIVVTILKLMRVHVHPICKTISRHQLAANKHQDILHTIHKRVSFVLWIYVAYTCQSRL